jgi:hypothetical protein
MTLERKVMWLFASNAVINLKTITPLAITGGYLVGDVARRAATRQAGEPSASGPQWAPA